MKEGQKGLEVSIGRGGGIVKDDSVKITLKDPMVKISGIKAGDGNMSTRGMILSRQEPRTFSRKDGSTGSLASLMIGDETGKVRVTVWDTKIADVDPFQPGETIEILHGYTREGFNGGVEVNVGSRGIIRKSETPVVYEEPVTKIGDVTPDNSFNVKGTVTGIDGVRRSSPPRTARPDGCAASGSPTRAAGCGSSSGASTRTSPRRFPSATRCWSLTRRRRSA